MNDRFAGMAQFRGGRIGSATVPTQLIEPTDDAALLQKALLKKQRPFDWQEVVTMTGGAAVVIALVAWVCVYALLKTGWLS